jgi:hypothetical protein
MLPYKIVQDLNPAAAPENSSTLNVNVNFDILKQALINEQGFDKLSTTGKEIIGSTILPNNSICVFSVINIANTLYSEIGIITDTIYKIVLRDSPTASLGFTTEHQIQAQSKVNFNGDYVVYWVDGFNPDRWLNVTIPQVDIIFAALTDIPTIANAAQLGLMLGFTPTRGEYIDQTATTITGGSLTAAVYYIICTYGDKYKNFTQTLYVSSPIPVTASQLPFNNEFIGSAAGTVTDKAITISIAAARLNPEYDFIRVQVIRKQNQVLSGWTFGEFPFNASTTFTCLIDDLTNEVPVDSILINLANYKSSLTITQLDDVLYKANLKSKASFDFQPYVNNTVINYIQKPITLDLATAGQNYKDPNMCFYSKGFMYDEVYAFYQSFIIEEDGQEYETEAYHIPGREEALINLGTATPPLEGDLITSLTGANYTSTYYVDGTINDCTPLSQLSRVSPQAKVMHGVATADNPNAATNMGYWENDNENYANRNSWLVLDANGTPTGDYRTDKVRHHRFPEPYNATTPSKSIHPSTGLTADYSIVNILGVELSNIVIPVEYTGKVKKIKLYYAKREFNDRTVLGQSLMTSLCQFHTFTGAFDVDNQIISGIGNFLHWEMPANNTNPNSIGMFPLGYERTTAQDASKWTWNDDNKVIRPKDDVSGFFKLKPFDIMQQSLTTLTTSYIKNLYRIPGRYFAQGATGTIGDYQSTTKVNYLFDPSDNSNFYGGINRTIRAGVSTLGNQYRKLVNIEYVDQNVPTVPGNAGVTPYGFSMNPYNYAGDKAVWAQTEKRLFYSVDNPGLGSGVNADIAAPSFYSAAAFNADNIAGFRASPYVSNMCAFKVSLFTTFDNQILCEAGVVDILDSPKQFYGGDTFTSYYGERSTFDTTAYSPTSPTDFHGFINTIHYYVSQSTGNINYRYKGNNTWETFYPKETWEFMRNLPFINAEWYGYNNDYSANNDLLQPVIASNAESQFQDVFPNRVIRSATDNPEIMSDNYLIYEAGNYRDVGKAKGPIENIANQNSKLLIKARKALFYTLGREIINTENSESYVGAGDIFAVKPKESVSSDSYGGGIGRFSDVITQYGYMYADATNGIVYVAAPASTSKGDSINEISNEGLQIFFRTELKFKLPEQLYNKYFSILPAFSGASVSYVIDFYVTFNGEIWKSNTAIANSSLAYPGQSSSWDKVDFYTLTDNTTDIQGIGIHATFDYKYRRYILAKKDYNFVEFPTQWLANIPAANPANYGKIVYYNGILYTLAASGTTLPRGNFGVKVNFATYFEDKSFTIAYYPESKAWVSMYDYYPNFLFNTIDKVYSTKNTNVFKHNSNIQNNFYYDDTITESFIEPILNSPGGVKKFSSISFYTDVFVKTITTKALQYLSTFTSYFVRNTWQMSKETTINNGTTSRNAERVFNTNDFRDFTRDNNEPLMDTQYISEQNLSNLNVTKHWSLQKKFVDYFLIPRFKFKQAWEIINLGTNNIVFNSSTVLYSPAFTFNIGDTITFVYPNTLTYIFTITKILAGNLYEFENRGVNAAFPAMTISIFDYLPNKEIHIYDISSQSTKNIR